MCGRIGCRWASASSWGTRLIAPTDRGISVFDITPAAVVEHDAPPMPGPAVAVTDGADVLAWCPDTDAGVVGFTDGQWHRLPDWPRRVVQLVPLLDGSVLRIAADDDAAMTAAGEGDDAVVLSIAPLSNVSVDREHVNQLVGQLGDDDEDVRRSAFDELSRYGPGVWPVIDAIDPETLPPLARLRLAALLRARTLPALGGCD